MANDQQSEVEPGDHRQALGCNMLIHEGVDDQAALQVQRFEYVAKSN